MAFDLNDWVQDNLGHLTPSAHGEMTAVCPFCGKGAQHFYINPDKWAFVCFSCEVRGRGFGGIVKLIASAEGVSESEVRRRLAKDVMPFRRRRGCLGVEGEAPSGDSKPEGKPSSMDLPPEYTPVWDGRSWKMPVYLLRRGFARETAKRWGLGFCQGGRYHGRVVIPIRCPSGESFTARDTTGAQQPRYLNPKGVDHGALLFGWGSVVGGPIFLVEGPLDSLKMIQHGYPTVALLGKALHAAQLMLLATLPRDTPIIVMLDPEEHEAPFKVAAQLTCRFERIFTCRLEEGIDPGASKPDDVRAAIDRMTRFAGDRTDVLRQKLKRISMI